MRSFRRGFRSRGRSNRKSRKSYWSGFRFTGVGVELAGVDVATAWAHWPSGLRDPDSGEITAQDETIVRCLVGATVDVAFDVTGPNPFVAVLGLIAWDSISPNDLHKVVTVGAAPNPAWGAQYDWIVRIPFTFTGTGTVEVTAADTWINSRAMRKLPPNTGLLACLGLQDPILGIDSDTYTMGWSADFRMLFKQGYYSV